MKKSMGKSYRKIQSEYRYDNFTQQPRPQLFGTQSMTSISNHNIPAKLTFREFLEKQKNGQITRKPAQSENTLRSIAPIKIESNYNKNNSPRFRIKMLTTPLSTNKSAFSKSPPTTRPHLEQDYICESQIQTSRLERVFQDLDETTLLSSKSPTHHEIREATPSVIKSRNVINSIDNELMLKEQIKPPKRTKRQLRHCLLRALKKLKDMNMTTKMMMQKQIFSKRPYQKPNSQEFIHAVKLNQLEKVQQFLEKNQYLVFDFDFFNMSALHWASKKGLYEMAELLIKHHSDVDGIDILNRTPLYLAIQGNHIPIVELLLRSKAYCWSTSVTDLGEVVKDNKKIRKILTFIRRLDIINMWGERRVREEFF